MTKKSHQRIHDIVSSDDERTCEVCNREIVLSAEDSIYKNAYFRHKPSGYRWGDRAKRAEDKLNEISCILGTFFTIYDDDKLFAASTLDDMVLPLRAFVKQK